MRPLPATGAASSAFASPGRIKIFNLILLTSFRILADIFAADEDHRFFLDCLVQASRLRRVRIHAYLLSPVQKVMHEAGRER